ncbi:MAG: CvpA family protein, partial [Pseudomonas sp.]|nr:CvpA family protein [Pseudomonas sp.]MDZ4301846.1 CvpA family protein [Pseudomonas sp.]
MPFTWVDWAIVAIIAISALISLSRGFVKEALS